jgi:hypothetical protein
MWNRARLEAERSNWGVLVVALAIVLVPAQLCRFYPDFPFPVDRLGRAIRLSFGTNAPSYEHFSSGLGLSLAFSCVVWFILYVVFPLAERNVVHKNNFLAFVRLRLIEPSAWRDYLGMLAIPVIYPSYRSWEWELCQAHTPHICPGGNGDGTIQYGQIVLDHVGIVLFLFAAWRFVRHQRLTHHSTGPARKITQTG